MHMLGMMDTQMQVHMEGGTRQPTCEHEGVGCG